MIAATLHSALAERDATPARNQESYYAFVRAVASDEHIEHIELVRLLDALDKKGSEFQSDVDRCRKRNDLRARLADIPRHEARAREIQVEMKALDAKLESARQDHARAHWPLSIELEGALLVTTSGNAIENNLVDNCPDEALRSRYATLKADLQVAEDRRVEAQRGGKPLDQYLAAVRSAQRACEACRRELLEY